MKGSEDDSYDECGQIADWTMQGVRKLASAHSHSGPCPLVAAEAPFLSGAFLSALRAKDVAKAAELGQKSGNWPGLALEAICHIDQAWQDDTLCFGDISETYWTLRRTLDVLTAVPVKGRAPSLSIGTAVIYIPSTEQHTFGPQMLVDQINRLGWDAQLQHGLDFSGLMEHLGSRHVDVLGISIGTDYCLDGVADLTFDARRCSVNPDISILIGGSAICGAAGQYAFLNADWVATSAKDGLHFFERGWSELKRKGGRFHG